MRQNRSKDKACSKAIVGFLGEKGRKSRVNRIKLANLSNSSGFWSRGNTGLVCKSHIKELAGDIDLGLVDLYMKGMFAGKMFILGIS